MMVLFTEALRGAALLVSIVGMLAGLYALALIVGGA
ncbi:hypothetical protein J2X65_001680 [Ancylobacter sp. 3268]|nr:hypothetical protein [Ancylobacter sp. 3268]